ncbi:putative pentatricopeptide repeat-containing protein At3g49142 [Phoenix dactylifera]|uniref:Pentatricopeptide repeat-containing protein At3g49142 n=1 Tax=Phoenix dactylifera TaxID=42345 RepID=A0A8B9AXF0_PHODC|nr:putative pentatricopeptide repeat-containing protein At3g49142 [Phoenix dactylifera]
MVAYRFFPNSTPESSNPPSTPSTPSSLPASPTPTSSPNHLPPAERILAKAFSETSPPPLFLWNETIKAHSRNGCFRESIDVYRRMLARGLRPNAFTFTFVLPACAGVRSAPDGRRVHEDAVRFGCDSNLFVATALVDMYISNGKCEEAMSIFDQMQRLGVQYDAMTMVSIVQACASLGALQKGRWVHEQVISAHMEINVHLGAALINMYARCGSIEESRRVFNEMPRRDLIRFSHKGMVHKGQIYFKKMTEEYCIKPTLEHCSCMVDLLGRAGRLVEAEEFIRKMHLEPDPGVWVDCWYVLMSNIYATVRRWDGVAKMRLLMKERKVSKSPGWSSIEIGGQRHSFLSFDRSHPRSDEIYMLIKNLEERMQSEDTLQKQNVCW